ncbi:MAG TPA: carboxypeptidase-like regulatory domain-containing protein [Blastocatellia bacterium]|nr:carboxypeptidase-like regulatory domain-containing protein [Blastocatellia bacterium]
MKRVMIVAFVALCFATAAAAAQRKAGTLKGKVENEKGKPIADVGVRVESSRTRLVKETKTDQSGSYSLELEPDDYTVSFDAEQYTSGTMRDMQQVEEGKTTEVKTMRLAKAKRTSLIRGAVFDSRGVSLAGARVKLVRVPNEDEEKDKKRVDSLSLSYTTNNHGEFAFRLPAVRARYRVTASADGFKSNTKVIDVTESEAVPVAFSLEPAKSK